MLYNIHLQLFAEGGGEAGGEGQNAAGKGIDFEAEFARQFGGAGVAAQQKAEPEAKPETKQEPEPEKGEAQEQSETEDADAEFEKLIKGKYKDAYGKRAQAMINDRFKSKNAELAQANERYERLKKAVGSYISKLGVDADDPDAIEKAALDDVTNFRARAIENNRTVEEERQASEAEVQKAEQEAAQQAQAQAVAAQQEEARRQQVFAAWDAEAEELKKTDPGFDLATEIQTNEEFRKALDAGLSVTFAYKASHFDDRMAAVAGAVEKQTAINTAKKIAAGRQRPPEGGLQTAAAVNDRTDYHNLSDQDFMAIFNQSLKH